LVYGAQSRFRLALAVVADGQVKVTKVPKAAKGVEGQHKGRKKRGKTGRPTGTTACLASNSSELRATRHGIQASVLA